MAGWSPTKAYFWQYAPVFRLLPPLVVAIICYDRNWLSPTAVLAPWLLVGTTAFLSIALLRRQSFFSKIGLFLLLQLLVFMLGWWLMQQNDIRQKNNWFAAREVPGTSAYLVRVKSDPAAKERTWRMLVTIEKAMADSIGAPICGQGFLSIYKDSLPFTIAKDDLLLVPADWQAIKNAGNPFEFDYVTFCRRRNIFHQQICGREQIQIVQKGGQDAAGIISRGHAFCQHQLDTYVTDTTTRGILQAMLLGDEAGFDPSLRQAYAETGVIHIISISGSHVGILFLVITLLLFWINGRKGQVIKYLAGVTAIWFYVLMAGAPPSALRAALMFSIVAISITFDKQANALNTLLAAAFILLLGNPAWLFAVGFQLSFGAVLGLVLFFRPLLQSWPQRTKAGRWLWAAVSASIAAELLTAPLAIYYFHNFPLFFIVANLMAAILLGVIVLVGGMAIIAFCWLAPIARGIGILVTWMVSVFNKMIIPVQQWSPASFRHLQISAVELLLLYAIIITAALLLIHKIKAGLPVLLGLSCIFCGLLCLDKSKALQQHRIVVYNSGRQLILEEIKGQHFSPLVPDSADIDDYTSRQAHLGWHAWHRAPLQQPPYFRFKGKHILLLNHEILPTPATSLPVDILVITHPLKHSAARDIQAIFHPEKIVVTGTFPRWLVRQWADSCTVIHQPFHAVALDGAYVLE
jgi:competence protein ComEC